MFNPKIQIAGYLSLILHAHLPFVRHPEHERFLEETWLFEAITECYLPLLQVMQSWEREQIEFRLTLSLSPTLCAMLQDSMLQERYLRHLDNLIELAGKESFRTLLDKQLNPVAEWYLQRFENLRSTYLNLDGDLVQVFGRFQQKGFIEIITTAATHAVLPLLNHSPSIRAQVLVARDQYRACFGRDPRGIWLPECAYADAVESAIREANIRWFVVDAHGLLHAEPRPRYGVFTPIFTRSGIAAFGRDIESARQVWSRNQGYPGDPRYRDFYRDIGFDLDYDYLDPYLPAPPNRSFTGIKYYRITGNTVQKEIYDRAAALDAAATHAEHFIKARAKQIRDLNAMMDQPPLIVCPYDAELFGHWWYEGPEFLDFFFRRIGAEPEFALITPEEYLRRHATHQAAQPGASSWGEEGFWKMWLNEDTQWVFRHLQISQERMTELARKFPEADGLTKRALNQAARELLLAQSSDWPFILRTGTSPEYARQRITDHLLRFLTIHEQLTRNERDENWLSRIESLDNLFPNLNYRYWA